METRSRKSNVGKTSKGSERPRKNKRAKVDILKEVDLPASVGCQTIDSNVLNSNSLDIRNTCLGENRPAVDSLRLTTVLKEKLISSNSILVEFIEEATKSSNFESDIDMCMRIFKVIETRYKQSMLEQDCALGEYEDSLVICKTELVEVKNCLQDVLNKFRNAKAEVVSIRRLMKNCLANNESKLGSLEQEKLDMAQCIEDQKATIQHLSNSFASILIEVKRRKEENHSFKIEVSKLQKENKDLKENIEVMGAHIFCGADSSQEGSKHIQADEMMEHICALQVEKQALEDKHSSYEKTIAYLRQQLKGKACLEVSLTRLNMDLSESLMTIHEYKTRLSEQEKQNSEMLLQLDSLRNSISSMDGEIRAKSKSSRELMIEKCALTKELSFCISNLKQLNGNLKEAVQGCGTDCLTPIIIALQFKFSCPMIQSLANELIESFSHLKMFLKLFCGLTDNLAGSPELTVTSGSRSVHNGDTTISVWHRTDPRLLLGACEPLEDFEDPHTLSHQHKTLVSFLLVVFLRFLRKTSK